MAVEPKVVVIFAARGLGKLDRLTSRKVGCFDRKQSSLGAGGCQGSCQ